MNIKNENFLSTKFAIPPNNLPVECWLEISGVQIKLAGSYNRDEDAWLLWDTDGVQITANGKTAKQVFWQQWKADPTQ